MYHYVLKAKALWKIIHNEIETRTKQTKGSKPTCRELNAWSEIGKPPKSKTDKFRSAHRSLTPTEVTPVCERWSFSSRGMDKRCLIPASVTFIHLERLSSFKLVIPGKREQTLVKQHFKCLLFKVLVQYKMTNHSSKLQPESKSKSNLNLQEAKVQGY